MTNTTQKQHNISESGDYFGDLTGTLRKLYVVKPANTDHGSLSTSLSQ